MRTGRPAPPLPGRLAHAGYALGGALCGGSVVGGAEGLYVLASTRPAEYGAFAYGVVLYGAAGVALGAPLALVLAALGRRARFGAERAWSASVAAAAAALATVVLHARVGARLVDLGVTHPLLVAALGTGVLALVGAWFGGHVVAKTPLRLLASARGTVGAWFAGLAVAVLLSASPAPGAATTLAPGRPLPAEPRPDVILVVVDGLRTDALGAYGAPTGATPRLDAFARDAVVFEQHVAAAGTTAPAVASIFTATPAGLHGVAADGDVLGGDLPTVAEVLRDAGYATGGLPNATSVSGTRGFDRGFDWYPLTREDPLHASESAAALTLYRPLRAAWEARVPRPPVDAWHTPAPAQLAAADTFLRANRLAFLFVHLAEPNLPWFATDGRVLHDVPSRDTAQSLADEARRLYADEVTRVDDALGAFLDRLRAAGRYDGALVVVTADHGEELGGRGGLGHGETLYDDIVRVPLLVKLPGNARAGTRVPWQVRAVDVAPTIVEAAGLAPPEAWRGATVFDDWFEDDLALLRPPDPEPDDLGAPFTPPGWAEHPGSRPALVELSTPNGGLVAVREGGLKLVRRTGSVVPGSACYDLRAEPGEVRALPPDEARCRRADIADALLGGWTGVRPPPTPAEDPPAEDENPLVVAPDEEE